jgi:hypothetical protein
VNVVARELQQRQERKRVEDWSLRWWSLVPYSVPMPRLRPRREPDCQCLSSTGGLKSRASVADFGSKIGASTSVSSKPSVGNLKAGDRSPRWEEVWGAMKINLQRIGC